MTLPNFLVVGAAKSGTTSLYYYLDQHPKIFMSTHKEPDFFIDAHGLDSLEEYEKLFSGVKDEKAIGEASTGYIYVKEAPGRISSTLNNDVKIIIILRNPIEMAYSLFCHMRRNGVEDLTFEEALEVEGNRRADPTFRKEDRGWYADFFYTDRALYYEQVKRYIDTFGASQVHIELFEDFKKNTDSVCKRIFNFLRIEENININTSKVYNPTGKIRFSILHDLANKDFLLKSLLKKIVPMHILNPIKEKANLLNIVPQKKSPIDSSTREKLVHVFSADIEKLESLIKKDLSAWKC